MLKKVLLTAALLLGTYNLAQAQHREPSPEAKEQAKEIGNAMRMFRMLSVISGEKPLSDAEIDQIEEQLAYGLDKETQHDYLCGTVTGAAVGLAMNEYTTKEMIKGGVDLHEMLESIEEDIAELTPGSLDDWLFQDARNIIPSLATSSEGDKAYSEANKVVFHECKQHHIVTAMNSHTQMNSNEMHELETCYEDKTKCPK